MLALIGMFFICDEEMVLVVSKSITEERQMGAGH